MSSSGYFCEKCHKTMNADQFYTSYNLEKYPNDGKLNLCKKCITMHVDNWNPDTYLWILQEIDVPYIPDEWNNIMLKYAKDPEKVTGTTILGRYLSKMKLKQWKEYRWKDSDFLQQIENKKKEEAMKKMGYDAAEIAQALAEQRVPIPEPPVGYASPAASIAVQQEVVDDLDLTEEDIVYLKLKWGKTYKPEEWVWLEQLFCEMMDSYDIQLAGHIDTLKLACKCSLKANQLLDIGDIDGAQKATKMYDSLMKAGKFTAAQNKAENGEFISSISELVMICEKEGFIPRYYIDSPKDKVDATLADLKGYTYSLITEEMNLGTLIESAVKSMTIEENKDEDEDIDENEPTTLEEIDALKYEDYEELTNLIYEETEEDLISLEEMTNGSK